MRFRFTQEQHQFRQEVSDFLRQEMSPEYETVFGTFSEEKYWFSRDLFRRLAERRWLTVGWPEEYGGGGKTFLEQSILDEQIGYHKVQRVGITGINFAGPAIIKFGTPEQKARYLPPIARGDAEYCQGFTEPDAGSDLASLQMRAEADGDHFVLNGSKMFTSYYAHADFIYLLARTDPDAPKHRGISLFIVEMDTPGISTASAAIYQRRGCGSDLLRQRSRTAFVPGGAGKPGLVSRHDDAGLRAGRAGTIRAGASNLR